MKTIKTLTLGELIEVLQEAQEEYGPDVPVVTSTDYGDYNHTPQALGFVGNPSLTFLKETAYSRSGFRVSDADEEDANVQDSEDYPKALLIL